MQHFGGSQRLHAGNARRASVGSSSGGVAARPQPPPRTTAQAAAAVLRAGGSSTRGLSHQHQQQLRPGRRRVRVSSALDASTATTTQQDAGSGGVPDAAPLPDQPSPQKQQEQHPGSAAAGPDAAAAARPGGGAAAGGSVPGGSWEEEIEETLKLVRLLPPSVRGALEAHARLHELLEVVMDLGRPPLARFPGSDERLSAAAVTAADLDFAIAQVGEFGGDNRAGIDATLHRISCLRNRAGRIVGLTCRVGRAIHGSAALVADLVAGGASVLFMGRPGVGKTTAIRELSRLLADDLARRVVIVDTSNEIGGDGDVPHAGIGRARRMQVPDPDAQHRVMIEAVENHMPQVVVIDEIGAEAECGAARTIAQRGVQLVATAHGNELQNLVKNPALSDLVGGVVSVTLGDDEAKRRGVQKSVLERGAPPTFDVAVEMLDRHRWHVYTDVAAAVDALLAGQHPGGQVRERAADGSVLKYGYSSGGAGAGAGAAAAAAAKGGGGGSGLVLPDPRAFGGGGAGDAAAAGLLPPPTPSADALGGFVRPRLFDADAASISGRDSSGSSSSSSRGGGGGGGGGGGRGGGGADPTVTTRRGRSVRLGRASPDGAALRLHASELDEERLWEVMAAMGLHDDVWLAPSPDGADAVLAIRSRLKGNPGLRAAARSAGVPVYAIKSGSSANLVRAFRTLLGLEPAAGGAAVPPPGSDGATSSDDDEDEGDDDGRGSPAGGLMSVASSKGGAGAAGGRLIGASDEDSDDDGGDEAASSSSDSDERPDVHAAAAMPAPRSRGAGATRALLDEEEAEEEARVAVESIVLPLRQPCELAPRAEPLRRAQAALIGRAGLACETVGSGADARLRVLPTPVPATPPGGSAAATAAAVVAATAAGGGESANVGA